MTEIASIHYLTGKPFTKGDTICSVCRDTFNATDDSYCGPNEDIPVCRACQAEEESYENVAQPFHVTRRPPR